VPAPLSEKLLPFVDLRNRLVHTYWKISKDELLKIAKEQLPVFESFVKLALLQLKNNR